MEYFIKTFGCQMNESDSERIASFLEKQGYKAVKGADSSAEALAKADLIVVIACSVRQSAIDRIFGLKQKFKKLKAKKILTGCILKSDKRRFERFFDEVSDIKEFLGNNYLSLKSHCLFKKSAFVPIMTGCDNFCTYCVVPYTRGREISRPVKEIVEEVGDLLKKGYKEIILLGQNVNSYLPAGKADQYGFSKLLDKLNSLPGDFTIKFLTNHPKDFSDELIKTIAICQKVVKEIHLPIQSGDDKILRRMNRGYTVKQYKNLVKKIRRKIPNVKLSTDVIVGFPGETKKQFENTVKLFKEIKYDKAYINKYSPRAGTAAVKLKDSIPWKEKKRRWGALNNLVKKRASLRLVTRRVKKKRRWNVLSEIVNKKEKPKLIVVLGPTASGKSGLAVEFARKFNGEIISADSRQVYKGMDIGTGKITKKEMRNISHYLLDVASPKRQFTVAQYRKKALEAINSIYKKDKIPILCGGTGFYIQAVVEGLVIPKIKPDLKLRKELERLSTEALFKKLKKLDPRRAKNIDSKNRRRLIRALEIIIKTGKSVPKLKREPPFDVLYVGIKQPLPELKKAINKRVNKMIKQGLEKEVKRLVKKYSWTTVLSNAIGYQEWLTDNPIMNIKLHTFQFAKRQMTWFKRNKQIYWVKSYKQAEKLAREFLE